jgi:hypothetical protein
MRLSKDQIADAMEDEMKIENDWLHNGVDNPRDPNFRWNAPTMTMPDHHATATADIQRRQAIQKTHDDKVRAELEAEKKKNARL